jgi:hypothetical protein
MFGPPPAPPIRHEEHAFADTLEHGILAATLNARKRRDHQMVRRLGEFLLILRARVLFFDFLYSTTLFQITKKLPRLQHLDEAGGDQKEEEPEAWKR